MVNIRLGSAKEQVFRFTQARMAASTNGVVLSVTVLEVGKDLSLLFTRLSSNRLGQLGPRLGTKLETCRT